MDAPQKRLIRNIVAGVILLMLIVLVLAWLGVFEGEQSDEAQIRALIERSREEISDHEFDDFFRLCDLTPEEREEWEKAVPKQANFVVIDAITPQGLISVPSGADEYEIDVTVVGHLDLLGKSVQADSDSGTLYFVKVDGRWLIDIHRSAKTFRYVTPP